MNYTLPKRRKGKARRGPARNRKYMRWIATFACLVCGLLACDPCHTKVLGPGGMGQKPSDWSCLPFCRIHHREMDAGMERKTFELRYGLDLRAEVARFNEMYKKAA